MPTENPIPPTAAAIVSHEDGSFELHVPADKSILKAHTALLGAVYSLLVQDDPEFMLLVHRRVKQLWDASAANAAPNYIQETLKGKGKA